MQVTIKLVAKKLNIEYAIAQGIVKFMEIKQLAKEIGVEKTPGAKGKGSKLYEIPNQITINFNETQPELTENLV